MAAAAASMAAMGGNLFLVEITDYAQTNDWKLLSADEWKALQSEMKEESRLYSRALDAVKRMWKADPRTQKAHFPASAIGPREAKLVGSPFADPDKAQAKLDEIFVRKAQEEADRIDREKDEARKIRDKLRDRRVSKSAKENIKRDLAREQERKAFSRIAVEMLVGKIRELKGASAKGPAQPPGQAAQPVPSNQAAQPPPPAADKKNAKE